MALELHLPDLSDGALSLGPVPPRALPPRAPLPWHRRLRELLSAYLPLLLMALLALGTWWLVQNTPPAEAPRESAAPRHEPDYTMDDFTVERFATDGRLQGAHPGRAAAPLPRHRHARDRPGARSARSRPTAASPLAQARRALANGDGSEVQLLGDARVDAQPAPRGEPIEFRGEFLHAFLNTERVRSHLPVVVTQRRQRVPRRRHGLRQPGRQLQLQGQMRALLLPAAARAAAPGARAGAARERMSR